MNKKPAYNEISEEIPDWHEDSPCLSKQAVFGRMIEMLPDARGADAEVLAWLPGDDLLPVGYASYDCQFGEVLIANTPKGVCYLGVVNGSGSHVSEDFQKRFGYAGPRQTETPLQRAALDYLNGRMDAPLPLHLKGTPYQTEIWRRLLRIPFGKVVSYATLAGYPNHSRAAGVAIGRNPVFWIVPCHRAVYADGGSDRYAWGKDIKAKLLAWEFAHSED